MHGLTFFLTLFRWFSIRPIARHPFRAGIVLLGIALGAAVFTSVRLSVRASLDAFTRSVDVLAGTSDAVVSRPGGRVPEGVVRDLLVHPDVADLAPFSSRYVREAGKEGGSFLLIGLDPLSDRSFRSWRASGEGEGEAWADLVADPFTLVAGRELADRMGWSAGDRIRLEGARATGSFRVLRLLDGAGLALADGGEVAITDIATFQEFTGTVGEVDRIDLRLARGDASWAGLRDALPQGLRLAPASEARESGRAMIRAYQLNLSVLSFASLFVGMFLVYSLVSLNAAARRREIAVLRSLGATRRTIFRLFLAEGGLFGLVGWLLAVPLGGLFIGYLLDGVSRTVSRLFVRVAVRGTDLGTWEVAFSLAVTVGVSLLAALQPAGAAMGVPPREAMAGLPEDPSKRVPEARLAAAGAAAVLAVLPLSVLPGVHGVPLPGYLAMLLLFVGFSLAAPWGIRRLGAASGPLLERIGGLPAFLAGRYVRDTGARTAVSVGALITAVALYAALVIMVHSFRGTVTLWVEQTISGDLFVTTRNAETNQIWEPFRPSEMAGLARLSEDEGLDLVASRRFSLQRGGLPYQIDFLDLEAFSRHGRFIWVEGDPERAMPPLVEGEGVLVSEVFANRTGLGKGALFEEMVDGVRLSLPVLGVVRDYRTRGGVVFASLEGLGAASAGWPGAGCAFSSGRPRNPPTQRWRPCGRASWSGSATGPTRCPARPCGGRCCASSTKPSP